jgi:hypothetical protein
VAANTRLRIRAIRKRRARRRSETARVASGVLVIASQSAREG